MKKLILILLLALVFNPISRAQSLCEDPCPPGPKIWKTIPLCFVTNYPTTRLDGTSITIPQVNTVFVEIAYRIRDCNGIKSIIIEDYVFIDNRDYLVTVDPWFIGAIGASTCPYPNPPTPNSIKTAIADAISKLLIDVGNPTQGSYDVFFKGACNSIVTLVFPDSSFFTSAPDDLGKIDTTYVGTGSTITQSIPCNDGCCKVSYNWQMVTLSNGETISKWVAISAEGDIPNCETQTLPDYNSYSNKITAKIYDPISKLYLNVTGTVVGQEPCELKCPRILAPPPPDFTSSIKSDISKTKQNIELNASPVPFNSYIKLSSNLEIKKIVFYDINGRAILKTSILDVDIINTSDMKNGIYFLQVYYIGDIVKTIKVVKQ